MSDERATTDPAPGGVPPTSLTLRQVWQEFADDVLSLDRGLPATFLALCTRPAEVARRYLATRDPRLARPLRYLLTAMTLNLAVAWALFDRPVGQPIGEADRSQVRFLLEHSLLLLLIVIPLLALLMRLLFARLQVRLIDALVVLAYTQAQVVLLTTLAGLLASAWSSEKVLVVGSLVAAAYLVWAWSSFAQGSAWLRWSAALLMLVLGQVVNDLVVVGALRLMF